MVIPETEIVVTQDGAEVVRKTVPPGDYVIGRDGSCDLPVKSDTVSERHAQITINYDHAFIEDLGSDSGTFVNGQRVTTATRLWPSQKIQVGAATITLRRKRAPTDPEQSLAPQTEVVRRLLPEEVLREQKYDIGGQIAQGGMGAILSAKEIAIRREVAMKVMLDSGGQEDLLRFVEEAQITGQLEHPNIVPVHELSVDENDQVFYTMKLVRGVTLRQVLEGLVQGDAETIKKYPLSALLTVFQKVCDAVAFAHSKGVIHRDLKPDNIMLGDFGEVLVMDWGLAKTLGGTRSGASPTSEAEGNQGRAGARPSDASRTLAGSIMGTPQYMAPEQARGEIDALDARSDIYALGAILYHILTLYPPVEGATLDEILEKVSAGQFIPPIQRVLQAKPRPSAFAPVPEPDRPLPQAIDPNAPTLVHDGGAVGTAGPSRPRRDEAIAPYPRQRSALPLPHLPGGSVPESLNAVVLKAMALEQAARYQTIPELQADLTAYQTGFATRAENASLMKQIVLLIKRHKGVFATAAAAWFIITALAVWFVISIRASERETRRQVEIAKENARIAVENEQKATQNAKVAAANEQKAVAEKENTRRALARSQLALAEAAFRESDGVAMQVALNEVPDDLRDTNWNYLLARSDTSIGLLRVRGYSGSLTGVAADPAKPGLFALAKDTKYVALVNAASGQALWDVVITFPGKTGGKPKVAFSPDGTRIAVGREGDGGLVILDASNGSKLLEWEAPPSFSLEFSPDGKALLQCQDHDDLHFWDAATGKLLWANHSQGVVRAAFHPAGKWIAAFSQKEKLRLLNPQNGELLNDLKTLGPPGNIFSLAVSPDGRLLAYGDEHHKLRVLNPSESRVLWESDADSYFVGLAFTPDGNSLVSVNNRSQGRQSLRIWSAFTGSVLDSLLGGSGSASAMSIHPLSGEIAVAGSVSKTWRLPVTPQELWTQSTGGGRTTDRIANWGADDLLFYPDAGNTGLASVEAGGPAKPAPIWKGPSMKDFDDVGVSRDGRIAIVGERGSRGAAIVLTRTGRTVEQARQIELNPEVVTTNRTFRVSPTGDRVAFRAWQPNGGFIAEVWATGTGHKAAALEADGLLEFNDFGWLGNGERIVALATVVHARGVAGSQEQIIIWDAATGKRVQTLPSDSALNCLAVAPDGASFAEAGADRIVRIRDAQTLAVRQQFRAHDEAITALAFHPTQPALATGSEDLTVKLWNLETGRLLEEVHGPKATIAQLVFTGSGRRLACASNDRSMRVWELDSLKPEVLAMAAAAKPDAAGWENLLAKLKRDDVALNGHGWELNEGMLFSPASSWSPVALPGSYAQSSYQLRLKLRQLKPDGSAFNVILPVGERRVVFLFDAYPTEGHLTGLETIDGKTGPQVPGTIKGKQVLDTDQHELAIAVSLEGANARVEALLDEAPLYQWSGPVGALNVNEKWPPLPPGSLALGCFTPDWVVSAVKVKRLEAKP